MSEGQFAGLQRHLLTLSPNELSVVESQRSAKRKSAGVAYLLSFFLCWTGLHKAYLEQPGWAFIYFMCALFCIPLAPITFGIPLFVLSIAWFVDMFRVQARLSDLEGEHTLMALAAIGKPFVREQTHADYAKNGLPFITDESLRLAEEKMRPVVKLAGIAGLIGLVVVLGLATKSWFSHNDAVQSTTTTEMSTAVPAPATTAVEPVAEKNYHFELANDDGKPIEGAWRFFQDDSGGYVLVNKSLPYRGVAEGSKFGCQGVTPSDEAPTSLDKVFWTDAVSWDALNKYQLRTPEQVPAIWKSRLERVAARHFEWPQHEMAHPSEPEITREISPPKESKEDVALRLEHANLQRVRQELAQTNDQLAALRSKDLELGFKSSSLEQENAKLSEYNSHLLGEVVQTKTFEKLGSKSVSNIPLSLDSDKETPEISWEDVREFYPKAYKTDVEQRLNQASIKFAKGEVPLNYTKANVHFVISKDGRPSQISIRNIDGGTKAQADCISFIEAAGPFRPVISPDANVVQIDAELLADNSYPYVSSCELQVNQHHFR